LIYISAKIPSISVDLQQSFMTITQGSSRGQEKTWDNSWHLWASDSMEVKLLRTCLSNAEW